MLGLPSQKFIFRLFFDAHSLLSVCIVHPIYYNQYAMCACMTAYLFIVQYSCCIDSWDECMHLDLHAIHLKCTKEKYSSEFKHKFEFSLQLTHSVTQSVLLCDCKFYEEFLMRPKKNAYKLNKL